MFLRKWKKFFWLPLFLLAFVAGCQNQIGSEQTSVIASLRDVPANKMSFRFESDIPAPPEIERQKLTEDKNAAVQADFDQNRRLETLEKTFTSPNKQRIIAVYRKPDDLPSEYRLDMYAADGKLIRKITPNGLAVHFADTLVWSPDSTSAAFVGTIRLVGLAPQTMLSPMPNGEESLTTDANANVTANTNSEANTNTTSEPITTPTPQASEPQANVLTLRTEQIYVCNADGGDLKALTQNEGLIYFYFIWSPDSQKIAALAATWKEWQFGQSQADLKGEIFIPIGRPRLVERSGRERRLDDNFTNVQPVWSPDSSKVATAFDKEVRIYDASSDAPTQAGIPLRNQLLISSKTFDRNLEEKEKTETNSNLSQNADTNSNVAKNNNTNANNTNANAAPAPIVPQDVSTLPDENTLVSFNPITQLEWTEDATLYLQTGYIKEMKNAADSARSYLRWHRLILGLSATK